LTYSSADDRYYARSSWRQKYQGTSARTHRVTTGFVRDLLQMRPYRYGCVFRFTTASLRPLAGLEPARASVVPRDIRHEVGFPYSVVKHHTPLSIGRVRQLGSGSAQRRLPLH
jgi:hypothetical protein